MNYLWCYKIGGKKITSTLPAKGFSPPANSQELSSEELRREIANLKELAGRVAARCWDDQGLEAIYILERRKELLAQLEAR